MLLRVNVPVLAARSFNKLRIDTKIKWIQII